MKQIVAKKLVYDASVEHPVSFKSAGGAWMQVRIVSDRVVRVLCSPASGTNLILHSEPAPVALQISHDPQRHVVEIRTQCLIVLVDYRDGLCLRWKEASNSALFAKDLTNRAYVLDATSNGVYHYMCRNSTEVYCGLGERTGNFDLHGRRFRLEGFDAMGYDAEKTDPLYKHCPFYITLSKETGVAYGLFYNNMSRTVVDLGAEIDALWGPYRYYQAECGPVDYYLFFGPSVEAVFDGLASVVGRPLSLPPRYSLGYLASSMGYAEADNAQQLIEAFPELCRKHDIPCDGLHLSSGYTVSSSGERCVFTWNLKRFPDARKLIDKLRAHGIHVFANIKPWLLKSHPQYTTVQESKGFIWDGRNDQPAEVMQWSAGAGTCSVASYVDFTSRAGFNFWKQSVQSALLTYGISGCWNDNNEFTMADDTNLFAMEVTPAVPLPLSCLGSQSPASRVGAPLQTLMMAQCSYEAMEEFAPNLRPFVITRSAAPWCHRFASQTWSGDNLTDWNTIKFNIPMGLSACLSAFPGGYGHDVGGFAGPKPSPELLVRWVQAGILTPRFCMHSWNSDNSVTEPWMYPSVLPNIRRSMQFRMRLIPFLYALHVEFYRTVRPILRPILWHFQHDPRTYEQGFEYMLGEFVLVAPVFEEGARSRTVYLPANNAGWFNFDSGQHFAGGEEVTVAAPLKATLPPIFIPGGGMIPLGKKMRHVGEVADDERIVLLFPSLISGSSLRTTISLIDDDGISINHSLKGQYSELRLSMETLTDDALVRIGLQIVHFGYKPKFEMVWVVVGTSQERTIVIHGVEKPESKVDKKGRIMVGIPVAGTIQ